MATGPLQSALAALNRFNARSSQAKQQAQLLERAARYAQSQPSFADDLRACASADH